MSVAPIGLRCCISWEHGSAHLPCNMPSLCFVLTRASQLRIYGPDGSTYVSCNCGCGDKPEVASMYYNGIKKCSKGGESFPLPSKKIFETCEEFLRDT